jgi:glycosyltransferase involved in cell wall biosynthesis
LRILTIVRDLGLRGTQRAAQTFSLAYKRAGPEVAVLAHAAGGPRRRILEEAGIPVFVGAAESDRALAAAADFRPNVIHIHRAGNSDARETEILRRLGHGDRIVLETNVFGQVDYSNCPALIDVHMQISVFCLWRWLLRLGRKSRDQIGVLVPYPVQTTDFTGGSSEERERRRLTWGVPIDAYVCGHVGFKPSDRVFEGFERLAVRDPSAWMVCVALPSAMDERIRALPKSIQGRVVRIPATEDDRELCDVFSAFDCLLHAPRIGETFGYVVAEALVCGVAVVSLSRPHRDNGHLEVIGHGEGGLIAGSSKHFAEAVLQLRSNEALRERVRREGPERIRRLFDADLIAARALRVARHALAHRNRKVLRRALEEDPSLQTKVDDRSILELIANTLGGPNRRDVALMWLLNSPTGQRLVRLLRHRELLALRP